MPKLFESYTKEVETIISKLSNIPPIQNLSSNELSKYQSLIARKEKLQKHISKALNKHAKIVGRYQDKKSILDSTNINCRKYFKLEQKAAYKRDLSLYKLGFVKRKPTSPIIQNAKNYYVDNIQFPIASSFSPISDKLKNYKFSLKQKSPVLNFCSKGYHYLKYNLPSTLIKGSISVVKNVILSSRKLHSYFDNNICSFSRKITSNPSFKVVSYIANEARAEADLKSNPFLESLKVKSSPNSFYYQSSNTKTSKSIPCCYGVNADRGL